MYNVYMVNCFTGAQTQAACSSIEKAQAFMLAHYNGLKGTNLTSDETGMVWVFQHGTWFWVPVGLETKAYSHHCNTPDGLMENCMVEIFTLDEPMPYV